MAEAAGKQVAWQLPESLVYGDSGNDDCWLIRNWMDKMSSGRIYGFLIIALSLALALGASSAYAQQESKEQPAGSQRPERKEPGQARSGRPAGEGEKQKVERKVRLASEGQEPMVVVPYGFVDKDNNGINDLFADANGDGINDVTEKPYAHKFKFADKDKNKINDLFVDADGDGVNDLKIRFVDTDGDGINDNVIDTDGNRINDITGLKYSRKSLRGYKFGFIKEERVLMRGFIDEDGDGLPDFRQMRMRGAGFPPPGHDQFIDRDGDGIDDRRQSQRRHMRGKNE